MKTFGLRPDQILESLQLDEQGEPIVPEGKTAVPLVKLPPPEHDPRTHTAEPVLVWHADRVERDWRLVPRVLTPAEMLAAARAQMSAILDALPVADRAVVLPIRTSVEAALDRGDIELALYTVQTATIPEHLEPTRTAILNLFP